MGSDGVLGGNMGPGGGPHTVIPNGNTCCPGWNSTCPVCQQVLDIPASVLCFGKDTVVESWGFELDNCFSSVLGF